MRFISTILLFITFTSAYTQIKQTDTIPISSTLHKGNCFINLSTSFSQAGFIGGPTIGRSFSLIPTFETFYGNKISQKFGFGFFNSNVFGFKDSSGNLLGGRLRDYYFFTSINRHFNTKKDKWSFSISFGGCLGYENWRSHFKPVISETVFSYNFIAGGSLVFAPKKLFKISNPRIRFFMDVYIPIRIGNKVTFVPSGLGIKYKLN